MRPQYLDASKESATEGERKSIISGMVIHFRGTYVTWDDYMFTMGWENNPGRVHRMGKVDYGRVER